MAKHVQLRVIQKAGHIGLSGLACRPIDRFCRDFFKLTGKMQHRGLRKDLVLKILFDRSVYLVVFISLSVRLLLRISSLAGAFTNQRLQMVNQSTSSSVDANISVLPWRLLVQTAQDHSHPENMAVGLINHRIMTNNN